MHDLETITNKRKMNPFWPQLALAVAAMTTSIIGLKTPEYSWLVYFGAAIFSLSLLLIFLESPLGELVKSKAKRARDKVILKRYEKEYLFLLIELKTLETLSSKLYEIPKNEKFSCYDYHPHNSIYNILSKKISVFSRGDRLLHANYMTEEIVRSTENTLNQYDLRLKSGDLFFDNEQDLKYTQRELRKYESFVRKHNDLCRKINSILKCIQLSELNGYALTFDWSNAKPKNN